MSNEVELKLGLPRERVAALKRSSLLRSLSRGRAVTRRLTSVYFDTPDFAFSRSAMALRVRHDGRRRLQTLKLPVGRANGLQVHRELECEILGDRPDLDRIDDAALQAFFAENDITAGTIGPVFTTAFNRSVRALCLNDSEIEFALDLGEIKTAERALPICEAELELRSGDPRSLFELALALNEAVPLTLERRTKAARGYDMLSGTVPPRPERASAPRLGPGMTARDAFAEIARNCLAQLRANEACAADGRDPEGVHQMRVAVRRLRALVAAYRTLLEPEMQTLLVRELRWLQQRLGPARDWDVFVTETLAHLRASLPDEPGLETLLREAERVREAANVAARAALAGPRYTAVLLKIELWLDSGDWAHRSADPAAGVPKAAEGLDRPVTLFGQDVLERCHKRLRKLGGKHAALGEADLHRLRLRAKKMRYLAEFFRTLYPRKAARRYLATLAAVQDRLGSLNDAVVTGELLAELPRRWSVSGADALPAAKALGIVCGWQAARTDRDLAKVRAAWEAFRACRPFWRGE